MRLEKDSWTVAVILVFSQVVIVVVSALLLHTLFAQVSMRVFGFVGILLAGIARPLLHSKLTGVPLRLI